MFEENPEYNLMIKQQYKNYLKNKQSIQRKTDELLKACNVRYLIGDKQYLEHKLKQLGEEHLISIGGNGVIFKAKEKKYNNRMTVIDQLRQRNLRLNFYGGLYYELGNYEFDSTFNSIVEILKNMGVVYSVPDEERFIISGVNLDPDKFNYVIDYYNYFNL